MPKKQESIDHHLPCGTLTIRILPDSIAARSIVGTLAAIAKGNWDGKAHIAPLVRAKKRDPSQQG